MTGSEALSHSTLEPVCFRRGSAPGENNTGGLSLVKAETWFCWCSRKGDKRSGILHSFRMTRVAYSA